MNPRILLVEDDAVSRAFLAAAAEALPSLVETADTCALALRHAREGRFDLWLIDANLPDGSGADLLMALREHPGEGLALAHTASRDPRDHASLRAAGFSEVLVKPLTAATLQSALRRALDGAKACDDEIPAPSWDDAAALTALNGQQSHVEALRLLFLGELEGQRDAIRDAIAAGDTVRAGGVLHMLRASCGFVGATRLRDAVRWLESDLHSRSTLAHFDEAVDALLKRAPWPLRPR